MCAVKIGAFFFSLAFPFNKGGKMIYFKGIAGVSGKVKDENMDWERNDQIKEQREAAMEQELMELLKRKDYQPFNEEEMSGYFGYRGKDAGLFISLLDRLMEEGQVMQTRKGKYILPQSQGLLVGTLSKHKKGFGFVTPNGETGEADIFLSPKEAELAMNGDLVAVQILAPGESLRSREGRVLRIVKHACKEVVGTFFQERKFGFVVAEDRRINDAVFVKDINRNHAQNGDKVVVKLTSWPSKDRNAEGIITEIISQKDEVGGDIKALIRQYHLSPLYPLEAEQEALLVSGIGQEERTETEHAAQRNAPLDLEELAKRRDLRKETVVTIDGADARDFDDAVSVKRLKNGGFLLGVHIADVSHYVTEGSLLDQESLKRGCSVYLTDQVIPMLPHVLSNGICSLNPGVDRLTLSVEMKIDCQGNVWEHDIFPSVIRSSHRLVYDNVSDLLEQKDPEQLAKYEDIAEDLFAMEELAALLRKKRSERGSLDFDLDEAHISLDSEGIPVSVEVALRRTANRMIEEFMLAANETVAEHFYWMDVPFVYRIHEKPSAERMEEFSRFISSFGVRLKGNLDNVRTKALSDVIEQISGKPEEHVIHTVLLRSMKKAFYGTSCDGHFGLGVSYYCHFTSPIRRYPDLMIHRVIKEALAGKLDGARVEQLRKRTEEASALSSAAERVAQELEREVEKLKMAEYMSYHIGEQHKGLISGVAGFGFFVELSNTIEGLVRMTSLTDDYYEYEPEQYRLMGRRTKRIYALGSPVTVCVESVDRQAREINFTVMGQEGTLQHANRSGHLGKRKSLSASKKRKRT